MFKRRSTNKDHPLQSSIKPDLSMTALNLTLSEPFNHRHHSLRRKNILHAETYYSNFRFLPAAQVSLFGIPVCS
jgi:hypothetical protein